MFVGTAPPPNTFLPTPRTIGCTQRSRRSKSFSRSRVCTRSRLPTTFTCSCRFRISCTARARSGPELCGPGPREVGPAAGGHVLRDAVEERGDLVVLAALLVRPVGGEDVIRPPAEQEGVRALVRGTDLRPGDLVQQGCLPAAEREPLRVLVGAAGRLPDEVEGCEQLDVDEAHVVLPVRWLSRSGG